MTDLVHSRSRAYDSTVWLYRLTFLPAWHLFGWGHRRWLLARLAALGAREVLDAGTGTGWWAEVIARARPDAKVLGLDFSPRYLEVARRSISGLSNVALLEADLTRTGLESGRFDAIVCSRVLDTLPDRRGAFAELARLLRPGGELLLFLKGRARWPDRVLEVCFKAVTGAPPSVWNKVRVEDELDALAAETGLRVAAVDRGHFMTRVALVRS
jgi:ubiquinone/menaquinone biosynthesis C-methylase UbiE